MFLGERFSNALYPIYYLIILTKLIFFDFLLLEFGRGNRNFWNKRKGRAREGTIWLLIN